MLQVIPDCHNKASHIRLLDFNCTKLAFDLSWDSTCIYHEAESFPDFDFQWEACNYFHLNTYAPSYAY